MKRVAICLALLTVAFFILTEVSVGQWYQQSSGTTWSLNSVHFVDVNTGWAVADSASSWIILKTTDGGHSWTNQNSGPHRLIEVYFTDSNSGWAVGGNVFVRGTILATTNGGNSWTTQISGNILLSVYFTDSG